MAMKAHLESLAQRHHELETAISAEMKHPSHDDTRIAELKRLKLRLKDQIETIKAKHTQH
ncbi:MAG: DUF465 domain-containing protein [Parvularculaceae bacterium]|nr:DUF465 domain-containing protein [Parvularculaceae bacterium]